MCYDTFEVYENLAIEWSTPDAYTTHLTLRPGVYFTDGSYLDAYAAAFSLNRAAGMGGIAAITGMIDHAVATGDYTLTVVTEVPFAPILRHLAHPAASIISMEHYLAVGDAGFRDHPVGSGMFKFEAWDLGDRITLVRNDDWWGELPLIETVTWRQVPDAATRLIEVSTGGADIALGIAAPDLAVADADPNVVLRRRITLGNDYIGMNATAPYLSDYRIRQAINYALNTDVIVNHVWMGLGTPARGPINSIVFGWAPVTPFPHDLDRARELLTEAGVYPQGFSTEIWWNIGNPMRMDVAEIVANQLAEVNINVTVHAMEWGTILERTEAGDSHMFIMGWTSVTGDADYGLFPLFHSSMHGPNNRTFFGYAPLDALLDEARSELTPAGRQAIYAEAQEMIRNQAPWVFLRDGEEAIAVSPRLQGLIQNPGMHHNYGVVYFN
jgi:peptide/nickel transport system substrate-binding protein